MLFRSAQTGKTVDQFRKFNGLSGAAAGIVFRVEIDNNWLAFQIAETDDFPAGTLKLKTGRRNSFADDVVCHMKFAFLLSIFVYTRDMIPSV